MDTQDSLETAKMLYTLYIMDANKAAAYLRHLVNGAYQDGFDAAIDVDPRATRRQRPTKFRGGEEA